MAYIEARNLQYLYSTADVNSTGSFTISSNPTTIYWNSGTREERTKFKAKDRILSNLDNLIMVNEGNDDAMRILTAKHLLISSIHYENEVSKITDVLRWLDQLIIELALNNKIDLCLEH